MNPVHSFSIPARALIGLWVGMFFFGGYAARAMDRPLDTLYLFNVHADTLRLGFEDTLHVSAGDNDVLYAYHWDANGKNAGEENTLDFFFAGQRKNKITGSRVFPSARVYHFDITPTSPETHPAFLQDATDTVYLEAFPEYEHNGDASWLWVVDGDTLSDMGPQIRLTAKKEWINNPYFRVDCYVRTGEDEVLHAEAIMWFWGKTGRSIYLPEDKEGHTHHVYVFNQEFDRIYANPNDTLYLDAWWGPDEIREDSIVSFRWEYMSEYRYPEEYNRQDSPLKTVFFSGTRDRYILFAERSFNFDIFSPRQDIIFFLYWGLPEIETDSVWVFFPQYPYSNLGGRVDICLPPDAPLPMDSDTIQTFNLGPWNRELEYVEYAWLDGTKDVSGRDSVVGTDSAFAYLFGRMDSVAPDLYAGMLVTRVASDSLWQDSCNCYIPCTEAACSKYDTVQIYLHLLPSLRENVFLPYDTSLCAHLDLELNLSDTAGDYRCYWLDRDSVALPYGYDTARYTVQGMRGLDGYGAGTDTREPRFFQLRLDHKLCGVSFFDTLLVYDQVNPNFELLCHDTLICLDEPVEIDTLSPQVYRPFYVFEWNDGTKGSGYTFTDSGVYVLRFFVNKDYAICGYDTAFDTIYVRWSDPAQTLITLSDTSFCEKLSVILDASVPFPTTLYSWQDGPIPDPEDVFEDEEDSIVFTSPIKTIKEEGTYNISLLDTMGCINRKQIEVTMEDCTPKLDIPNVFTPNGDGVNDVWKFKQLEKCLDVKVEVVDRWGQPVLKTKVATADDFGWNGTINNRGRRLPDGPYFYMVSYKDVYGKSKVQSGSITILGTSE